MKKSLFTAYYSLKTGKRVKPSYGEKNPDAVFRLSITPSFLLRSDVARFLAHHDGVIDVNGMPANFRSAKLAKFKWDEHQGKLALRRKQYALNALGKKAAEKVTKKSRTVLKANLKSGGMASAVLS